MLGWLSVRPQVKPNIVTFNTLLMALQRCSRGIEAEMVLMRMRGFKCTPDLTTYVTVISALGSEGLWQEAYDLFQRMEAEGGWGPGGLIITAVLGTVITPPGGV